MVMSSNGAHWMQLLNMSRSIVPATLYIKRLQFNKNHLNKHKDTVTKHIKNIDILHTETQFLTHLYPFRFIFHSVTQSM